MKRKAGSEPWEINPRGHVWKTHEDDGSINIFAYETGYHNGPACASGYGFCHHCTKEVEYQCPNPNAQ